MKLPQLSLRDLFWLVLVVGMGCAWCVDRSRLAADRTRFADLLDFALKKIEILNASAETMRLLYAEPDDR